MAQKQRTLAYTALNNPSHRFTNLYRLMHWRPWIEAAANRVLARPGSSTAGVDGTTRDAFRKQFDAEITRIVQLLKTKTYQPLPVRRVFIPKRSGKARPLGIPTVTPYCGVVQYAVRMPGRDTPLPPAGGPAAADSVHAASSGQPPVCL
jgi:hypothetical protein